MDLIVTNGICYTPEGPKQADVGVLEGRIAAIGELRSEYPSAKVYDAQGRAVLPGLIDMHVHADDRIGEFNLADNWVTVSSAAIKTGVTSQLGFCTQHNAETMQQGLSRCYGRALGRSYCDVGFHVTPTGYTDSMWQEMRHLGSDGLHTLKLYTTYKQAGLYVDEHRMEKVFLLAARMGWTVLVHCEDEDVLQKSKKTPTDASNAMLHAVIRPEEAEVAAVRKVVRLANRTETRVHIVHVSSPESVNAIREWDTHELVTCETAMQYVLLNEKRLEGARGHRYLCTPPLRSEQSRSSLLQIVKSGGIDCLATDHCAFSPQDKDLHKDDFQRVPNGLAGAGSLVPLAVELLVGGDPSGWSDVVRMLSENPARVCGLYPKKGCLAVGSDADLVVVDVQGASRPVISSEQDCYEPYGDFESRLNVRLALLRGRDVVRNNRLVRPTVPTGGNVWD